MNKETINPELRLAEIEVEMEIVEVEIEEREKTDPNKLDGFANPAHAWEIYCKHMQPFWDKFNKLGRERRMLMTPEFKELKENKNVMSLKEFIECVETGGFIDYDGFGNYVRDDKESNITIIPSDVQHGCVRKDFDTIIWYNR